MGNSLIGHDDQQRSEHSCCSSEALSARGSRRLGSVIKAWCGHSRRYKRRKNSRAGTSGQKELGPCEPKHFDASTQTANHLPHSELPSQRCSAGARPLKTVSSQRILYFPDTQQPPVVVLTVLTTQKYAARKARKFEKQG